MDSKTEESKKKELLERRKSKKKELEAKVGPKKKVACVLVFGEEFWITSPSRPAWHAFKSAVMDPKRKATAMENLASAHVLEPANFGERILEGEPALAEVIANRVAELGGMDDESEMVDFSEA